MISYIKKFILLELFVIFVVSNNVYAVETVVRIAFDPNLPPYQFIENGDYVGIHIDAMNEIAKKNNFIVTYIPVEGRSNCFDALESGKVDAVLGVENGRYASNNVYYTENLSQSYICIIASREKASSIQNMFSIDNYTAVVEDGTVRYSYIRNMRNLKYTVVPNQIHAFELLSNGSVDLLIGVKHSILYQLDRAKLENDYVIINNYVTPIEYGIAVKKRPDDLLDKLNGGIRQLRISGEYEAIYDKWINEDKYAVRALIEKVIKIAAIIFITAAAFFAFNIKLNRYLKHQVDQKTRELQKINKSLEHQILVTKHSNELKNCIVENSPAGIVVFDSQFAVTLFNNSIAKIIGLKSIRIGCNMFELDLFREILIDKRESIFKENTKYINQEIKIKNEISESIVYRYNIYQLFNTDNSVRGAILNIEDVTREIKLKDEIYEKEKNKALNQIIAGIAHEIRNPLMSIKTFVELIPNKIESAKFQNQLVEFVPKEVERVSNLIKSLIDYAKPEKLNKEYVNVEDIVQSCSILMNPVLKNKRMKLETDIEKGVSIYADKDKIKQVIINIILNGFESMQDKLKNSEEPLCVLHMKIKAWNDDSHVYIQIHDDGMGMTPEEIKKSTELFFTTKANGSGIGLPLSKQFTEESGGTLIIESKKYVYTTITLKFRR